MASPERKFQTFHCWERVLNMIQPFYRFLLYLLRGGEGNTRIQKYNQSIVSLSYLSFIPRTWEIIKKNQTCDFHMTQTMSLRQKRKIKQSWSLPVVAQQEVITNGDDSSVGFPPLRERRAPEASCSHVGSARSHPETLKKHLCSFCTLRFPQL